MACPLVLLDRHPALVAQAQASHRLEGSLALLEALGPLEALAVVEDPPDHVSALS